MALLDVGDPAQKHAQGALFTLATRPCLVVGLAEDFQLLLANMLSRHVRTVAGCSTPTLAAVAVVHVATGSSQGPCANIHVGQRLGQQCIQVRHRGGVGLVPIPLGGCSASRDCVITER